MKKNIDNILMALFVAAFIVAAFGIIFQIKVMTSIALCVLTLTVGVYAGFQTFDYLSIATVEDDADVKRNRTLLIQVIVSVAVCLILLCVTIFNLAGKLF